jgi:hypothetical protein
MVGRAPVLLLAAAAMALLLAPGAQASIFCTPCSQCPSYGAVSG